MYFDKKKKKHSSLDWKFVPCSGMISSRTISFEIYNSSTLSFLTPSHNVSKSLVGLRLFHPLLTKDTKREATNKRENSIETNSNVVSYSSSSFAVKNIYTFSNSVYHHIHENRSMSLSFLPSFLRTYIALGRPRKKESPEKGKTVLEEPPPIPLVSFSWRSMSG